MKNDMEFIRDYLEWEVDSMTNTLANPLSAFYIYVYLYIFLIFLEEFKKND